MNIQSAISLPFTLSSWDFQVLGLGCIQDSVFLPGFLCCEKSRNLLFLQYLLWNFFFILVECLDNQINLFCDKYF